MERRIGIAGVTANVIGVVIGIAIFILPGQLAVTAGPAVVLSYLLAGVMAAFACVVAAQIGCVFSVSGASFVAVSRIISPLCGFIVVWLMIGAISLGIALLAYGFADYLQYFLPGLDRLTVALMLVLGLGGVNLLGVKNSLLLQVVLVLAIVVALTVFSVAGLANINRGHFTPFIPMGWSPVLLATIPAFFSFAGFTVIIELGGEIKNPAKTIPWSFAIGFVVVLLLYLSVTVATVGIIPWQELADVSAPVGDAARRVLPATVATGIVLVALAGAASTVNALMLSYSRDVMVLGKSGVFPRVLANTSTRHGEPNNGIIFITLLATLMILFGGSIKAIATLSTLSILIMQIALGVVVLLLPVKAADLYNNAPFKLGRFTLLFFGAGLIVISAAFLLIAAWGEGKIFLVMLGFLVVGIAYYLWRNSLLQRRGIDMRQAVLASEFK